MILYCLFFFILYGLIDLFNINLKFRESISCIIYSAFISIHYLCYCFVHLKQSGMNVYHVHFIFRFICSTELEKLFNNFFTFFITLLCYFLMNFIDLYYSPTDDGLSIITKHVLEN